MAFTWLEQKAMLKPTTVYYAGLEKSQPTHNFRFISTFD